MRLLAVSLLLLSGLACANVSSYAPLKKAPAPQICTPPDVDLMALEKSVLELNRYVGSWPLHLKDDAERKRVTEQWSTNLLQAEKLHDEEGDTERSLILLAETYRQGHNLDIKGMAQNAHHTIGTCLAKYPQSRGCNLAASYFYLSINPARTERAAAALNTLRELAGDKPDPEVENGFIFLYVFEGNKDAAIAQIDRYIQLFPGSPQVSHLNQLRDALVNNRVSIHKSDSPQ